jgi:serine/threonine protein kinase/class 3 adenylate cyclase
MSEDSAQGTDDTVVSPKSGDGSDAPSRLGHGDVVGERWRLDEFLKRGGMGRVWKATDLRLREPVALKLMDPALVETDAARARFMREAQAAARVRGPNVVQVLDFDVDAATRVPYLAMELLHGEDLAERLARGPLAFDVTADLVAGICNAIGRAHRLQVVHRDLKPGNVFLSDGDAGPECKVLDFGIVKLDGQVTRNPLTLTGATLGTVSYMSPEQIADAQKVDHRTDLWSIAVLAYECLTGRRPFRGDSLLELIHEICYSAPVPPSRLAIVPAGFDAWFTRATQRDRDHRFASARELLDALKNLGQPAAPRHPNTTATNPLRPDQPPAHSWASDANQIDIGVLKDLTFKNAVVREFLDGAHKHFVSGSKGLGKTLLLTYKRSLLGDQYQGPGREKKHAAVQFVPEGRPYLDLMGDLPTVDQAQIDLMSGLGECKRLWSFAFRFSIISYHPALVDAGDPEDLAPLPRRLRGFLEGRPVEPTMIIKELLALSVRQINQIIDALEGTLERRLRALHSGMFIFIDKLDQALRRLPRAAWVHMQAGMIEAAWDLMSTNRHVKIFATIREEAFSSYESDIKTNLYGATSTLRYAKHELFDLLEKLTYYYEGLPLRDFVLLDAVRTGRSARGESAFDFLYRHTLGRPRDLVILASEISRNRRALDERTFTRIVRDTSAGLLVANVFDEMRVFLEVLCDRDRRSRFLALLTHDVLRHDEVIAVWCAFHGVDRAYYDAHGHNSDDVWHPFRELFECGLLGVLVDDGAGGLVQKFRQPHDAVAGSLRDLPRSPRYLLHPALRALIEGLAGGGRFTALRHLVIGHGEPWPRHWDHLVDVQRELLRRPDAASAVGEPVHGLLDRLLAHTDAHGLAAARRAVTESPAYTRLLVQLERSGWDDLHLALLDLFPVAPVDPEPTAPHSDPRAAPVHHPPTPAPSDRAEVALMLVDIVRRARMVLEVGDTEFVAHLQRLRSELRASPALRFIKGTGDGYLAVYDTVERALVAARDLLGVLPDPAHLRLVLHWGAVRMSDQDVLGSEVHRLFRIESLGESDRTVPAAPGTNLDTLTLPVAGRVLLSASALAALPPPLRAAFTPLGDFRLRGFDAPETVWIDATP